MNMLKNKIENKIQSIKSKIKSRSVKNKYISGTRNGLKNLIIPWTIVVIFLILIPIIFVILYSLMKEGAGGLIFVFTWINFYEFFNESSLINSLFISTGIALANAMICLIIAYPIAYLMSEVTNKSTKKFYWIMITMPIWISMLVRIVALKITFEIIFPNASNTIGSWGPVLLGLIYTYLPFMILPLFVSLDKRDRALEDASMDLGAKKIQTFFKIIIPNSKVAILSGILLVFLPSITTIAVTRIMSDGSISGIGNIIENIFLTSTDFTLGAAISVVIMIMMFSLNWFLKIPERKEIKRGEDNE